MAANSSLEIQLTGDNRFLINPTMRSKRLPFNIVKGLGVMFQKQQEEEVCKIEKASKREPTIKRLENLQPPNACYERELTISQ